MFWVLPYDFPQLTPNLPALDEPIIARAARPSRHPAIQSVQALLPAARARPRDSLVRIEMLPTMFMTDFIVSAGGSVAGAATVVEPRVEHIPGQSVLI